MAAPRNDFTSPGGQGDGAFGVDPKTIPVDLHRRVPARPPSNDWDTTGQGEALGNQGGADEDNEDE